jgi:hypothetical protein
MKIATFTLSAVPSPPPAPRRALPGWTALAVRGLVMGAALVAMLVVTSLVFANP